MRVFLKCIVPSIGALLMCSGCSWQNDYPHVVDDAPDEPDIPEQPDTPPPTGQLWEEVVFDTGCGHQSIGWVLVDEMCGAVTATDYTARFRAPMFRDGVVIGSYLYTVDGTNLWVLDVTDPNSVPRKSLTAGFGTPISMAAHNGQLVIAAGKEGLLIVDVTDPTKPSRIATVALQGPALDVHVEGDRAVVAMGGAGIAAIDLAKNPPEVTASIEVEGFAAGVTSNKDMAYVAACGSLTAIDLTNNEVLASTWLDNAYSGQYLVAPAKDVTVIDNVAYVAAGRFGAVAIDVTDPKTMAVVGNCTIPNELSFYASGVRAENGKLFVAGGEWGVLPVSTEVSCTSFVKPVLPSYPNEGGEEETECSSAPPWEVSPWQDTWAPPPAGKDPIQTLPMGDILYTFGDARRNALRAIDLKSTSVDSLPNVGRYEEPRLATAITSNEDTVVVLGEGGGVFLKDEVNLLVPIADAPAFPADAVAVAVLADGRWVCGTNSGQVFVNGEPKLATGAPIWPYGIATLGNAIAVASSGGIQVLDLETEKETTVAFPEKANLPPSLLWDKNGFAVAAPEWTHAVFAGNNGAFAELPKHEFFDEQDIAQLSLWQRGVPQRILLGASNQLIEIVTLGGNAGLFSHTTSARLDLPKGQYRGGAAIGQRVYLVSADRASYRSQLITIGTDTNNLAILSTESFIGVVNGITATSDRLYVADGDKGIRVYSRTDNETTWLGTISSNGVLP